VIVPDWEVDRGAGSGTHFNGEAMSESGEEVPSGASCMLAGLSLTEPMSRLGGLNGFCKTEGFCGDAPNCRPKMEVLLVRRGGEAWKYK
jgi:hypothetical protein